VRSKLLALREEDYCTAARLMGASPKRIIGRHLLPGFMSHLIAAASLSIPSMILGETALSFLGIGLRPPITSWGVLLNEAQNINVVALYPWLMMPVVPVIIVILAFNFFGWPFSWWVSAQGALVVYVLIIGYYAYYMNKLDIEHDVAEEE